VTATTIEMAIGLRKYSRKTRGITFHEEIKNLAKPSE
jgi:hypothetical protein